MCLLAIILQWFLAHRKTFCYCTGAKRVKTPSAQKLLPAQRWGRTVWGTIHSRNVIAQFATYFAFCRKIWKTTSWSTRTGVQDYFSSCPLEPLAGLWFCNVWKKATLNGFLGFVYVNKHDQGEDPLFCKCVPCWLSFFWDVWQPLGEKNMHHKPMKRERADRSCWRATSSVVPGTPCANRTPMEGRHLLADGIPLNARYTCMCLMFSFVQAEWCWMDKS